MSAYPHIQPTASPAELERLRLEEAERRLASFCVDLNKIVGRRMPERDGEADDLTRRIYAAAAEAGVPLEDDTSWMTAAAPVLSHLRGQVDAAIYARVCAAWTGELPNVGDVARALEFAKGYFEVGEPEPDLILDLATCLLDYAFVRTALERPARGVVFPQTSTDGGLAVVRQEVAALERRREHIVAVREGRSLLLLSRSLRIIGTVGLAAAWLLTGQVVFVPLVAVLWLMSWMLVDRREVERDPEPATLLEEALDRREEPAARMVRCLGPVWPFVAPRIVEGPPLEECSVCGEAGRFAGTYQGRDVCSSCAEQLR